MTIILGWIWFALKYLFNPDKTFSDFLVQFKLSWWKHELWLFAHRGGFIILEAPILLLINRHPRFFIWLGQRLRYAWIYIRYAARWVIRLFWKQLPRRKAKRRSSIKENWSHLSLSDMSIVAAVPHCAKGANYAMVRQWPEFGVRGYLAVWLGGCIGIAALPYLGNWAYFLSLIFLIAVKVLMRIWRYFSWPVPQWLKRLMAKVAP